MTTWVPKRSFEECYRILCGPGELHEIETKLVGDQVQRVYKNMWPSLRDFWLWATSEYKDATYIVFEKHRRTYNEAFQRSIVIAAMLRARYNIQKGDRIIICSRNFPEYLPTFWASQLIGAVCVFMNAWLPIEPSKHCISNTQAKLVIADPERADMLEPFTNEIAKSAGTVGFLVWEQQEGKGKWAGFDLWTQVVEGQPAVDTHAFLHELPALGPEDNAAICFTSGTTGLPKGVLSTHRQFLTNVLNVMVSTRLASLRKGESYSRDLGIPGPQKAILISVPLFHVTGMTSMSMLGTLRGLKLVFMRRWVTDEGANLIKRENVAVAGGVPSMVSDLADSSAAGHPLDGLLFGGASAPDWLAKRAREAFPAAMSSQAYGLTETNSVAVGFAGEDYDYRPTSAGRASPVNDILVVKGDKVVLPGELGEVWLRGPNVMKCYWNDPAATAKAVTRDGWMRSGDIGYLDHEGFLYIRDRIKDLIIRGGENVDSVSVENAVSADERLLEVAAVGVPDARLGELVTVVACVKPAFKGKVREEEVIESASKRLAKFAVPVMIVLQDERLPRTPSAKILKTDLRHLAKAEWERRRGNATSQVRPKL